MRNLGSSLDFLCWKSSLQSFVLCSPVTLINNEGGSISLLTILVDRRVVVWYRLSQFIEGNVTSWRQIIEYIREQLRSLGIPIHPSIPDVTHLYQPSTEGFSCLWTATKVKFLFVMQLDRKFKKYKNYAWQLNFEISR